MCIVVTTYIKDCLGKYSLNFQQRLSQTHKFFTSVFYTTQWLGNRSYKIKSKHLSRFFKVRFQQNIGIYD